MFQKTTIQHGRISLQQIPHQLEAHSLTFPKYGIYNPMAAFMLNTKGEMIYEVPQVHFCQAELVVNARPTNLLIRIPWVTVCWWVAHLIAKVAFWPTKPPRAPVV